jgi:phosphotransferase system HPr-like phosphotransfer protein
MTSFYIRLNSIDKVKQFVNLVTRYESDFDLTSGRYVVDAKSIMGIFSLDLSKPLKLDVHNDAHSKLLETALEDFLISDNDLLEDKQ